MIIKYSIILCVSFVSYYGLPIGTDSGNYPLDKSAQPDDLFPDWVPFKNKHGDELGKFTTVKNKVKKRLALPMNFLLRNLESDDYFDKDGGGDSEDYFEKKDWSDLHRPAEVAKEKIVLDHGALSEIDGIVSILSKESDNLLKKVANVHMDKNRDRPGDTPILNFNANQPVVEAPEIEINVNENDQKKRENTNVTEKPEKEITNEEEPVKEDTEEESKGKIALESVDELKRRHAEEQKDISERAKEEEMYKELFQRYVAPVDENKDKSHRRKIHKPAPPDYDEYEDQNTSLNEKYKLKPVLKETDNPDHGTTTEIPSTEAPKFRTSKYVETGKLSVFRNPQLYMIYDDDDDLTTPRPARSGNNKTSKYSSYKVTTSPTIEDDERISLVPVESKEGEPTLFLPTKRKEKRLRNKNTTPSQVNHDLEDTSASDTQQTVDVTTAVEEAVSGPDVADAASDNQNSVEPKDYHSEKGGGKEHHSQYDEEHEEHGKKSYEGHHEDHKTAKGHHDKEDHLGKYDDHGGLDKHHHEDSEHYGDHHHEEHGKKHAKYEESGKHSKGHSTKGSHDIHKKEEYEKKVEFFEEEGDSDEEEKHGGYKHEREHKKGGHFKNGNLQAGHNQRSKGETGSYDTGRHVHAHKGHNVAQGDDGYGKKHKQNFQREAKTGGKKWIYHHGTPAKTANLVVIDRRGDQLYHGPHYYG